MVYSRIEVTSETQRRKTLTSLVTVILVNTIHNFTSKIWSPIAGFWASLSSWVYMLVRLRMALEGTGLSTCLHLVAPFSSKCLTCFVGQTCRSSNNFCSFGAVQLVKNKGPSAEKERGSAREQWPLMTSSEKCRRPHQQCRLNSQGVVSILKASSLKMFLMCVWHRKERLSLMQL